MIFAMQKESCIMKGSLRRDVEPDFAKKLVAIRSHQHRVKAKTENKYIEIAAYSKAC